MVNHDHDDLVELLKSFLPPDNLNAVGETALEIGTHRGETGAALLHAFPGLTLGMVDSWAVYQDGHPYREAFPDFGGLSREQQRENRAAARSATDFASSRRMLFACDSQAAAVRWSSVKRLWFVFVDGDLRYEGVLADLRTWWPRVQPGGLMLGRIYDDADVVEGVWGAVEEFCDEVGMTYGATKDFWVVQRPDQDNADKRTDSGQGV